MRSFISSQNGAVTTETMVITAGVIGLVIATFSAVSSTSENGATGIVNAMKGGQADRFEDVNYTPTASTGASDQVKGSIAGWSAINGDTIEVFRTDSSIYYAGYVTSGAGLDVAGVGVSNGLQKEYNLNAGETYGLDISALDVYGGNSADVYFGGELVGTVTPGHTYNGTNTSFTVTGGSGDGSDVLQLVSQTGGNSVFVTDVVMTPR